jgi:hypothetical protein
MQCPECNSTHIRKNGQRRGKQTSRIPDCEQNLYDTGRGGREHGRGGTISQGCIARVCAIHALEEMLRHSVRLLLHYLKFRDLPVPT